MVHSLRVTVARARPLASSSRAKDSISARRTANKARERARHHVVNWRRSSAYASLVRPRYPARNPARASQQRPDHFQPGRPREWRGDHVHRPQRDRGQRDADRSQAQIQCQGAAGGLHATKATPAKGCPASPARLPGFILAAELIRPDGRCLAARAAATFEVTTHRPEGTPRCLLTTASGRCRGLAGHRAAARAGRRLRLAAGTFSPCSSCSVRSCSYLPCSP